MVQVKLIQSNDIMSLERDLNENLEGLAGAGHKDDDLSVQYNICPINSIVSTTGMIVIKNIEERA